MEKSSYFCGVDVAKDSFVASIKNGRFLTKDKTFVMDRVGFKNFERSIKRFRENITVGMEPTGIYHNNLLNFLKERNYNSVVVNPYMLHQFFKFTNNKPTKTDRKDSKTITEFLEFKKDGFKENLKTMDERYSIRYFVREKEKITQSIAKAKTEIKRILSLVFPEIETHSGVFTKEIISIMLAIGAASKIRNMPRKDFIKKVGHIPDKGRGRKIKLSTDKIYELAKISVAGDYPDYEELLKIKIRRLNGLLEEKGYITKLITEKAERLFKDEIEILCSIPGVGQESSVYLMAELIDIKRFSEWRKLIGFCGLDPIIKQSGKFKINCRISKRGNAHARRIAWIMAGCVKRSCPYFREYYLKKRSEGKSYKEAIVATSTKLLRTVYALLNENRCFR